MANLITYNSFLKIFTNIDLNILKDGLFELFMVKYRMFLIAFVTRLLHSENVYQLCVNWCKMGIN